MNVDQAQETVLRAPDGDGVLVGRREHEGPPALLSTLVEKPPDVSVPVLFVHGEVDPLPPESSFQTAERPGEIRRIVGEFPATQT
jgi:hypothetical protein